MQPIRIAFGCQARVGKDTACEYLKQKYGGDIRHFSDPMYKILHYAQNICGFENQKDVKFLQWIGTEWGRAKKESVWIDATLNQLSDKNCYIGDVRFRNEITALKDAGFLCIRILRNDRPIDRDQKHQSEIDLKDYQDWDGVIYNNGSLEELYEKLDTIVQIALNKFKDKQS